MITYQDFEKAQNRAGFLSDAIAKHRSSGEYQTAVTADLYDRQMNATVNRVMTAYGGAQHRVASNFFNRLNTQRCSYSLGNGVSFTRKQTRMSEAGVPYQADLTKEALGPGFDTALYRWGYKALIHGVCFGFWNMDRLMVFPITQFVPFWDEWTGALRAGLRYWRLDANRPLVAELYEADGYTVYRSPEGMVGGTLEEAEAKRPYIRHGTRVGNGEWVAEAGSNYPGLPVVPMWGSPLKQSTLVGMRGNIDAFDLIQSGFAEDLRECAQIYWIIQNNGGMSDEDLREFLNDIREKHVAKVDTSGFDGSAEGALKPFVQEIPYQGRGNFLDRARNRIYEDFGALDVHALAAGSTNDHIDAAYQPLDENADLFEYQVIEAVQAILRLMGIEDTPIFKRNRISNVKEQVEAVMLAANYLDEETVLDLIPLVTVDMKPGIMQRREMENAARFTEGDGE